MILLAVAGPRRADERSGTQLGREHPGRSGPTFVACDVERPLLFSGSLA